MSRGRFKGNVELVQYLKLSGIISTDKVFDTMCQVDRGKYTHSTEAYVDEPRSIGFNATISAPHMHAYALEYLSDKLCGGRALDIGSGSGYLTTCMALMNGPTGTVIGIEHMPELQEVARRNIESDHPELLRNGRIKLVVGDGRLGYPSEAPFDAIHVGAASSETPNSLINQLAPGGRMIIPMGPPNNQTLFKIDKSLNSEISQTPLMGVRYVPLTDKERQYKS